MSGATPRYWLLPPLTRKNCAIVVFQAPVIVVVFLDKAIQVNDVLHRALAESGFADNDAAPVILDRAGKDFRGGGAVTIHQHGERPRIADAGFRVVIDIDPARGVFGLHHRASIDKQPGQFQRLGQ